jgi:hypothetical protein
MLLVLGVWLLGYSQGRADGRAQGMIDELNAIIKGLTGGPSRT